MDTGMSLHVTAQTLLGDTYTVTRLIGVGGMGEVYEASHARLPGRYAVKILLGDIPGRSESMQRFRREAEVTSALRHPNIVQVLDFNFTPDGTPYLVMEFLDGVELAQEMKRVGAMPIERVLDIVGQIASGLAAAHSQNVVHRDLKPQNIFLVKLPGSDREIVKIVDFGISKVREVATKLTLDQSILGTPQYMAPEQAQGKLDQITDRTDQFALAATMYELVTGRPAFAGSSVYAILYQVVHEQPESLAKIVPSVGPAVEAVVFKALSKAPADRHPSVMAFHAELLRAVAMDGQVYTLQTPSPLWLPPEPSTEVQKPGETAPNSSRPIEGTAKKAPTTPTAILPQVAAPTAILVPTSEMAQSPAPAPVAPTSTTTLGSSVGTIQATKEQRRPKRRWLFWGAAMALAFLAGLGYWGVRHYGNHRGTSWGAETTDAMPPTPVLAVRPTTLPKVETIQVVYSTHKVAWMQAVTTDFEKAHPDIHVDLVGKRSIEGPREILEGRLQPTVWSPADTAVLDKMGTDWRAKHNTDLIASDEDAKQPLLLTPLVFIVWEDRARVLKKAGGGTVTWTTIRQGMTSAKGWLAIGGEARWGTVSLGHAIPTEANSGLQALYSMFLEHTGKLRISLQDIQNAKHLDFVRGIERNVTKFEASTNALATDMVRFGSSRYDIAVVYESTAIAELAHAEGRWGKLTVCYPVPTLWSDNPAVVLAAPWVTEAQARAAHTYINYLHSYPAQVRALEYGFRPADTSLKILSADPQNPFTKYAEHGISVEVPPAADILDSTLIRSLMTTWTRMMKP
jgi:serine/threonine protein kinase